MVVGAHQRVSTLALARTGGGVGRTFTSRNRWLNVTSITFTRVVLAGSRNSDSDAANKAIFAK